MKRSMMLTIALAFCAAASGFGQARDDAGTNERGYFSHVSRYQEVDLIDLEQNLAASLASENDGVVESALAHATYMRIVLGKRDMPDLEKAIAQLVIGGRTLAIRAKASLAVTVFAASDRFAQMQGKRYADPDEFFDIVASSVRPLM